MNFISMAQLKKDETLLSLEPETHYYMVAQGDSKLVFFDIIFVARVDHRNTFKVYWMTEREASWGSIVHEAFSVWEEVALQGQKITDLQVAAGLFKPLVDAGLKPAV